MLDPINHSQSSTGRTSICCSKSHSFFNVAFWKMALPRNQWHVCRGFCSIMQKGESPGLGTMGGGQMWPHKRHTMTLVAHSDQVVGLQLTHPEHPYLKTTRKRKKETRALGSIRNAIPWNLRISFMRIVIPYIQSQFILPLGKRLQIWLHQKFTL